MAWTSQASFRRRPALLSGVCEFAYSPMAINTCSHAFRRAAGNRVYMDLGPNWGLISAVDSRDVCEFSASRSRVEAFWIAALAHVERSIDKDLEKLMLTQESITASHSHPAELGEVFFFPMMYIPGFSKESVNNASLVPVDTLEDLDRKWPVLLSEKPEFIKAFLIYSDEYEKRKNDSGWVHALDPRVVASRPSRQNTGSAIDIDPCPCARLQYMDPCFPDPEYIGCDRPHSS